MTFLSPHIEALAKKTATKSLIEKPISCGIFQDYGDQDSLREEKKAPEV